MYSIEFHVSPLILLICYINAIFFTKQIVHPKHINFQRKKKKQLTNRKLIIHRINSLIVSEKAKKRNERRSSC